MDGVAPELEIPARKKEMKVQDPVSKNAAALINIMVAVGNVDKVELLAQCLLRHRKVTLATVEAVLAEMSGLAQGPSPEIPDGDRRRSNGRYN